MKRRVSECLLVHHKSTTTCTVCQVLDDATSIKDSNKTTLQGFRYLYTLTSSSPSPDMLTFTTRALSLLFWVTTLLVSPTIAFPTSFPPHHYTNRDLISPDQVAYLGPTAPWMKSSYSPSIILCQDPSFQGRCTLFYNNARNTCLNVMWEDSNGGWNFGLDVKSLKIGDGAACALYE